MRVKPFAESNARFPSDVSVRILQKASDVRKRFVLSAPLYGNLAHKLAVFGYESVLLLLLFFDAAVVALFGNLQPFENERIHLRFHLFSELVAKHNFGVFVADFLKQRAVFVVIVHFAEIKLVPGVQRITAVGKRRRRLIFRLRLHKFVSRDNNVIGAFRLRNRLLKRRKRRAHFFYSVPFVWQIFNFNFHFHILLWINKYILI